jgi:hypothetical protein
MNEDRGIYLSRLIYVDANEILNRFNISDNIYLKSLISKYSKVSDVDHLNYGALVGHAKKIRGIAEKLKKEKEKIQKKKKDSKETLDQQLNFKGF